MRGRTIDIRAYEIAGIDRIAGELQPQTLSLVREGRALLGSILDHCKRVDPADWIAGEATTSTWSSYLPFERAIDATMANLGSHQVVEEIAFIAQLELRQREERLERVRPSQGTTVLLGECDSSLRRVRKALNAVDAAIATVESVPPLLDFTSELHTSLAVRRAYAKFRSRVMAGGEPTPDMLRIRFRGVGTQIAKLVGWDIYPEMRVQDRLLLRDLQQRVLDWLRGGTDTTAASGLRLWQDLAGCIEMFALVNRRQELVEHDSSIVRTASELLEAPELPERMWQVLRALEGLDPELDQLLAQTPADAAVLRSIIGRLAIQLGTAAPPVGEVPW
ncbi:MAG TPA: hypothetical protein VLB44_15630 [Kofleriaceae bacterium]|nr:hypothetical protein [Kofleriaceae bacterium]